MRPGQSPPRPPVPFAVAAHVHSWRGIDVRARMDPTGGVPPYRVLRGETHRKRSTSIFNRGSGTARSTRLLKSCLGAHAVSQEGLDSVSGTCVARALAVCGIHPWCLLPLSVFFLVSFATHGGTVSRRQPGLRAARAAQLTGPSTTRPSRAGRRAKEGRLPRRPLRQAQPRGGAPPRGH